MNLPISVNKRIAPQCPLFLLLKVVYISPTIMSIFCFRTIIHRHGARQLGSSIRHMIYNFGCLHVLLTKLLMWLIFTYLCIAISYVNYLRSSRFFLQRCCVLLSVGVQASLLQPIVYLQVFGNFYCSRWTFIQTSELCSSGAIPVYFQ